MTSGENVRPVAWVGSDVERGLETGPKSNDVENKHTRTNSMRTNEGGGDEPGHDDGCQTTRFLIEFFQTDLLRINPLQINDLRANGPMCCSWSVGCSKAAPRRRPPLPPAW